MTPACRILLAATLLLPGFHNPAAAQRQYEKWNFGYNASLDFSSGAPAPLSGSSLSAAEGGASIADPATGNLLFYTDGQTVYDRTHAVMSNGSGLLGHSSSTQSALILRRPGSTSIYYIFTSGAGLYAAGNNNGIRYSIVDMTMNAGLGAVTTKNTVLLGANATEKLTAAYHTNCTDFWIVSHGYGNNTFYAWRLSSGGVAAAVTTNIGAIHNGNSQYTIGEMKFSPGGAKLAVATYSMNSVQLFDFNRTSGAVSNAITLTMPPINYGLSFSPDNTKLYVTSENPTPQLYQFDVSSGVAATINASRVLIASPTGFEDYGMLQLAPNGKLYVSRESNSVILFPCCTTNIEDTIAVIHQPNSAGAACNYVDLGVWLGTGVNASYGLPNHFDGNFDLLGCNPIPLPVEFLSFDAGCDAGKINLNWSTASESMNHFFSVERSVNGIDFVVIRTIAGAGNSSSLRQYHFTDENFPDASAVYYRVKQTDFNGNYAYSAVRTVMCGRILRAGIFPNPAAGEALLSFDAEAETVVELNLMTAEGKLVRSFHFNAAEGKNEWPVDLSQLSQGLYIAEISSAGQKYFLRLVKADRE